MSRRRTLPNEHLGTSFTRPKRKAPTFPQPDQPSTPKEIEHDEPPAIVEHTSYNSPSHDAGQAPIPNADEAGQTPAEAKVKYPNRSILNGQTPEQTAELRKWLDIYLRNKGSCPVCHQPHSGRGITGHIFKCLRTLNSKPGLPTTT